MRDLVDSVLAWPRWAKWTVGIVTLLIVIGAVSGDPQSNEEPTTETVRVEAPPQTTNAPPPTTAEPAPSAPEPEPEPEPPKLHTREARAGGRERIDVQLPA